TPAGSENTSQGRREARPTRAISVGSRVIVEATQSTATLISPSPRLVIVAEANSFQYFAPRRRAAGVFGVASVLIAGLLYRRGLVLCQGAAAGAGQTVEHPVGLAARSGLVGELDEQFGQPLIEFCGPFGGDTRLAPVHIEDCLVRAGFQPRHLGGRPLQDALLTAHGGVDAVVVEHPRGAPPVLGHQ